MVYPALFILLSDWLGYPTIYNHATAAPLAVLFWIVAKRNGATKRLLTVPIVLVLLGSVVVVAISVAPNEAVEKLELHRSAD